MSNRECTHAFYCWYRLEGRCCHGAVENISTCKGQKPSSIYVELNYRGHRSPGMEPASEQNAARDR
jgi:hypothetical protein